MDTKKVAIITGASGGIGRGCALALAENSWNVVIHFFRDESAALSVVEEISQKGGTAIAVQADITKTDQVKQMITKTIETFGRVDGLVNNAGICIRKQPTDLTREDWISTLTTNLIAPIEIIRLLAEEMKEGGSIVQIGSMRTLNHTAKSNDYSASKIALQGLTGALAKEYAPRIRINTVAPGYTDTNLHKDSREKLQKSADVTPLARYASPEEIGNVVRFFLSADASFITGQTLFVDGGYSLGGG